MLKVSIIIPVRNEQLYIEDCLKRIINQNHKYTAEILLIDGLSTDETRGIINRFSRIDNSTSLLRNVESEGREEISSVIRLIDNPKGHRASALNIGVKETKSDVVIRIDSRTIIPPDYIEKCIKTLLETDADNVGGMQKPVITMPDHADNKSSLMQMAIGIALSHPFGVGNAQFRIGKKSGFVDTVYLGCFKRQIFDKVGLFDEESAVISEDADMNYRIRQAGGKVFFDNGIVAYYYPRDKVSELWKLYFRYGGAKAGNLIKRGHLTAWRQFVPPAFLVTLIFFPIAGIFFAPLLNLWLCILGIYLAVDFLTCIMLALNKQPSEFRPPTFIFNIDEAIINRKLSWGFKQQLSLFGRLLIVFPTIHFSWALGFWKRLLQRPKRGEYWGY